MSMSFQMHSKAPHVPHVAVMSKGKTQFWTRSRTCHPTVTLPQLAANLQAQYGAKAIVYYTTRDGSRMMLTS